MLRIFTRSISAAATFITNRKVFQMFYATDVKNRIYAFDSREARDGLIYDCVSTDCWAISASKAIAIMLRYICNAAMTKSAKEWSEIYDWVQNAREREIAAYYGSLIRKGR